jgi:glyoxylase-like metal-dependent hydrolase (beta-lactamase superfamily II)
MKIHKLVVGPILTNCYIACDENSSEAIIIDPGAESSKILSFVKDKSLKATRIVSTHGHFDHVNGVPEIKDNLSVPFYINEEDAYMLSPEATDFMKKMGYVAYPVKTDGFLKENEELKLGNSVLKIINTPGHTLGSICLYSKVDKTLFSGDTLFRGDVGRCDLQGGSLSQIASSIKNKLFVLPDDTIVYPGHGDSTTIGREKNNSYIKGLIKG